MLASGAGCDALVLTNPWTFEGSDDEQESPPEVVRDHYRKRLTDPAAIKRLLSGKVSLGKLFGSLQQQDVRVNGWQHACTSNKYGIVCSGRVTPL